MAKHRVRLILDTNLLISFLITKEYAHLDEILFVKNARLIFSQELLDEFLVVVKRPKFGRFYSQEEIEEILEIIEEFSDFVGVRSILDLCRDKKDNFLLSLAKDSKADFLITADKDLLELKTSGETKILTIKDFFEIEK